MGLFLGMDPDDMMTMAAEEGLDDPDLEAELAAITGGKAATVAGGKAKHKGRSELCLKMNDTSSWRWRIKSLLVQSTDT